MKMRIKLNVPVFIFEYELFVGDKTFGYFCNLKRIHINMSVHNEIRKVTTHRLSEMKLRGKK